MCTPRATACVRAVRHRERIRSKSHSASDSMRCSTSRPLSVDRSKPLFTETNVPPAAWIRSIAARPCTRERPKRSSSDTTRPSL
jgi:hypothetical protein